VPLSFAAACRIFAHNKVPRGGYLPLRRWGRTPEKWVWNFRCFKKFCRFANPSNSEAWSLPAVAKILDRPYNRRNRTLNRTSSVVSVNGYGTGIVLRSLVSSTQQTSTSTSTST